MSGAADIDSSSATAVMREVLSMVGLAKENPQ
jgi:hypothetical protein